ncbi:MAG: PDDEXK nuclease domain-containing protein [Thermoguttaceae bacterium]
MWQGFRPIELGQDAGLPSRLPDFGRTASKIVLDPLPATASGGKARGAGLLRGRGRQFPLVHPRAGAADSLPYYQREITAPDENPPVGVVLCTDKSEAVVRYTLPEDNQQIFASRYKLYLPTETELAVELQRQRQAIEMEGRLRKEADE